MYESFNFKNWLLCKLNEILESKEIQQSVRHKLIDNIILYCIYLKKNPKSELLNSAKCPITWY